MKEVVKCLKVPGMTEESAKDLQKTIDGLLSEGAISYKFYPPCSSDDFGFVIYRINN